MTWLWPSLLGLSCIVQPDTILRWHRAGFRAYWRWKSRARPGISWKPRVPRHREPEQLSSTVAHHEKRKQALECQRWNHAEIDRRDGVRMVAQECPPSLRWRPSSPDHVFGDRRLGDLKPKLEQFTMDAWGAPQWVLLAHPFRMSSRSSRLTLGLPGRPRDFQRQ